MTHVIIEEGYIFKKAGINHKEKVEYLMRELSYDDLDELMILQKEVYQSIENKKLYQMRKEREFIEYLDNGGIFLGVFVNEQLVAARITDVPGLKEHNYGYLLDYPEDRLLKSMHFKIMLVRPKYRGNGLQIRTMRLIEKMFIHKGYQYGLCRISPDNYYSLANALEFGLEIKSITAFKNHQKYIRCILEKDLDALQPITYQNIEYVDNTNIKKQQDLINNGFVGFKAKNFNLIDNFTIVYGKTEH